jgi:hypothetical protein
MINSEIEFQVIIIRPKGVIFCQNSLIDVALMAFAIQWWLSRMIFGLITTPLRCIIIGACHNSQMIASPQVGLLLLSPHLGLLSTSHE